MNRAIIYKKNAKNKKQITNLLKKEKKWHLEN